LDLNVRKKIVNCSIFSIALYGAENWILLKVEKKFPESFEMWYWSRMDKISWTDHVRNEEGITESRRKGMLYKKRTKRS
jgi:hypothetical protein